MFIQYRVYINLVEGGSTKEQVFEDFNQAYDFIQTQSSSSSYGKVKNAFITKETYNDEGKLTEEKDVYCKRNPLWYNESDELEVRIED